MFENYVVSQNFNWARHIGGIGNDALRSIAIDHSGNIYSTGSFSGTVDFDPGVSVFNLTASSWNGYITKFDALGNFVWAKQLNSNVSCFPSGLALDLFDNLCITGLYNGTCDFDPGSGLFTQTSNSSSSDCFICKLDPSGDLVWVRSIGGSQNDFGKGIVVDLANNLLVCGVFQDVVDFDSGAGTYTLNAPGGSSPMFDAFVCKLNMAGQFVWAKQFTSSGYEMSNSIATDNVGNVYTTGVFNSTSTDFDPGVGSFTLSSQGGLFGDNFVSKLDSLGNFIWAKQLTGSGEEEAFDITVDVSGSVLTCGYFNGTADFDPGPGTYTLYGGTGSLKNGFINKLDSQGNFLWTTSIGSTGADISTSIRTDALNNVYTIGSFQNLVDFDSGPGTFTLSSANKDCFLLKLDGAGNFNTAFKLGGSGVLSGEAVRTDTYGNIYIAGNFNSPNADFDPGVATYSFSSSGNDDLFLVKLYGSTCNLPTPPVNNSPATICSNVSPTLQVSASSYVLWYSSSSSVVSIGAGTAFALPLLSPGTYTYFAEANSCTVNPNRTTITFTVYAIPNISLAQTPANVICAGESTTLTASGANSYSWSTGGTGASVVVNPSTTTTYTVAGFDTNSCSASGVITQSVDACLGGIRYFSEEPSYTIYPNPGTGKFYLNSLSLNVGALVEIQDVNGKTVYAIKIQTPLTCIDLEGLPNGIYYLRLLNDNTAFKTEKIVKME